MDLKLNERLSRFRSIVNAPLQRPLMSDVTIDAPAAHAEAAPRATRLLAIWLWSLAALVLLMVVVGGATRLTESGLSITEWKPLSGVIPPLSQADWQAEFDHYKQIPQYESVFPNMDLAGFKFIFFWEWGHRLLARLIGFAAILPLAYFWLRGQMPASFKPKLALFLVPLAFEPLIGWWMVASGLQNRTEVAQERLAIHLLVASMVFAALVWLASSLKRRTASTSASPSLRRFGSLIVLVVFVQIGLGALVAGLRAGRVYNTWPLMDGSFIPPADVLGALSPLWRNLVDNVALVQLDHRLVAYTLLALTAIQAVVAARYGGKIALRGFILLGLVVVQAAIGIATLLLAVPLWAGLLHQAFAMLVLGKAIIYRQGLSA
jgi:heme a synthase